MSESERVITEAMERIAGAIMIVDLDDLSGLGKIHTDLEQIADSLREAQPAAGRLSDALARVVGKVILDELGECKDPLDLLARGIGLLQRMSRDPRPGTEEMPDDPALYEEIGRLSREDGESSGESEEGDGTEEEPAAEPEVEATPAPVASDPPSQEMIAEPTPGPEEAAPTIDAGIMSDFAQEAEEHLGSAESNLLALEKNPEDMETINAVFRSFHTIKGAAGFLNLGDITRVAHAIEDVLDAARKGKLRLNASVLDAGFSAIDILKDLLADARIVAEGAEGKPREMKDLLVKGFLSRIVTVVRGGRPGPEAAPPGVEAGLAAAPADKAAGEARKQDQQYVRVATEKLDHLVNMVGELVIAQTQVSQNPEMKSARDEKLLRDISQLNRITRDIQEVAMSMRMVPIRATFERMARLARDLARKFEKPIDFEMAGEETEVDKNVVEEIVDPLTHMMRNALDHGLEPVEDRAKAGKPANGLVSLEAYHKGGNIVIELRDDGRGIDREKVLKKAVERGLARPEDEYTDEQVYAFLFMPGFSTAEKVSDVSGRGVGMDVVRRNIEKLRGKVEIRSEKGKGSTFTIQLPLTLAIIEGMVVGVGPERYILPLTSIVRSLRPSRDEIFTVMDRGEMARVEGDLFPIVRLHGRYGVDPRSTCPWECLVVLVEAEGGKCCLMVDELLGIQQVVIKGLEDDLRNDKSLSGCTILGDGRVGLILDVNDLVRQTNGKAA